MIDNLERPLFRSHLQIEILSPEVVLVLSEFRPRQLKGRAFVELARLIDGRRSTDELIEAIGDRVAPAEALYALNRLQQTGLIVDGNGQAASSVDAFWDALGSSGSPHNCSRPVSSAVQLEAATSGLPIDSVRQTLEQSGLEIGDAGQLTIVVTDDYLRSELRSVNRRMLSERRPWLLAKPAGAIPWIGPLFAPGRTACWECISERIRANRQIEDFLKRSDHRETVQSAIVPGHACAVRLASQVLGLEVTKALSGISSLDTRLLTVDTTQLQFEFHPAVRRSDCGSCGKPLSADRLPTPVQLQSRSRSPVDDGGYRVWTPSQMLKSVATCVSPITGVVREIVEVENERKQSLHVYFGSYTTVPADSLKSLRRALGGNCAGKGSTSEQARASLCGEALERHCSVFRDDVPQRYANYHELGHLAIHPNRCMLYSDGQYADREQYNRNEHRNDRVPRLFDPDATIAWTPVWSLTNNEHRYLPTSYCYFNFPDCNFCFGDSNGNAAGSCLEESILQGFLELVERDAVALWWYNRVSHPPIDCARFDARFLRSIQRSYSELGRELHVLDITSDLGIPVVAAVSRSIVSESEDICLGFGAHFEPEIAIRRAITELNLTLPELRNSYVGGARKGGRSTSFIGGARPPTRISPSLLPARLNRGSHP